MDKTEIECTRNQPKQRYPEPRQIYANRVGNLGEIAIGHVLDDYEFHWHHVNAQGADFTMPSYDIGIEVWNHSKAHGYVERGQSVCDNLLNFEYKFLVASFISNGMRDMMDQNDVVVVELGFQVTLEEYVPFYQHNRQLEGKKTLNRRTLKILKNRLAPIFKAIKKQKKEMRKTNQSGLTQDHLSASYGNTTDTHVCIYSEPLIGPSNITGLLNNFTSRIASAVKIIKTRLRKMLGSKPLVNDVSGDYAYYSREINGCLKWAQGYTRHRKIVYDNRETGVLHRSWR